MLPEQTAKRLAQGEHCLGKRARDRWQRGCDPTQILAGSPSKALISAVIGFTAMVSSVANTVAREKFHRFGSSEIQRRFAGMEMTDRRSWRDVYERSGILRSFSMGQVTLGKWRIDNGELCRTGKGGLEGCYQVWGAGKSVVLAREGSEPLEGVLIVPADR
jgi:hypothetical protein